MIIRLFRENQIFTVLLTLLLSFLTGFFIIVSKNFSPGFGYIYLKSFYVIAPSLKLIGDYKALSTLLNLSLTIIIGFYLSRIMIKYSIITMRSLLPMFIFVVLSIPYFKEYTGFSYPLLTLLALLASLDMIFADIDLKTTSFRFFDGTLLLSVASFFNIYFIFFIVLLIIIWIQYRGFNWREFAFIVLGTIIPYLILFAVLYLKGINISPIVNQFKGLSELKSVIPLQDSLYYFVGLLGLSVLIGSAHIVRDYVKMKIVIRKYSLIFLYLFMAVLLIAFLFPIIERDIIFFFALPLSFLYSYYFTKCETNIFNQLLFLALIAGSLATIIF
jgi:hypothetical protein